MAEALPLESGKGASPLEVLRAGVKQGAFPGAVMAAGYRRNLAIVPVGQLSYGPDAASVMEDTIYDLASLTKVVATTTAAMILKDRGSLELDRPVGAYLPDFLQAFDTGDDPLWAARGEVTVRHLLAHTSGLPAYEKFFLRAREKSHVLDEVYDLPLEEPPGRKTLYSDVGFILLGELIERVTKEKLDAFCQREIFLPLRMRRTCFNPSKQVWDRIAPTEMDETFRKRLIRGEVQDENAWVMGGVAGHAGLFGTAGDLVPFCRLMLEGGRADDTQLVQPQTIEEFTRPWPAAQGNARGLGWDKPSESSSSGRYFSPSSYGHLGFTGTSLWIDPEKAVFVILLTNRIHPSRSNEAIQKIRPAVHDAVAEILGLAK